MKNQILVFDHDLESSDYRRFKNMDYTFVADTERAIEQLQRAPYALLLIADTISWGEECKLQKLARIFNENILFLKARTSPLPVVTINQMLARREKEERIQYAFIDDALKNASFNITIQ